jgi:L-iditol 2-dehydrogenase
MKELRVVGSFGYVWTSWNRCFQQLANNAIDTDKLISHIYPFERFEEALEALAGGLTVKVVMQPKISEDALSRVPVPNGASEHRQ